MIHLFLKTDSRLGPEKCPVYLKIPWIGDISLEYESQIKKAIISVFTLLNLVGSIILGSFFHLLKKIVFLPIKKVLLFTNFPADVKLGM